MRGLRMTAPKAAAAAGRRRKAGRGCAAALAAVLLLAGPAAGGSAAVAAPGAGLSAEDLLARARALTAAGDYAGARAALEVAAGRGLSGHVSRRHPNERAALTAAYELALLDLDGRPGADAARGYRRLEQAAAAGYGPALRRLATDQVAGLVQPAGAAAIASGYRDLSDGGSVVASIALGDLWARGALGAPDLPAAQQYYLRAANAGSGTARRRLALVLAARGEQAQAEAVLATVETGSVFALYRNLATDLGEGRGVPADAALGERWMALAHALLPPRPPKVRAAKPVALMSARALAALSPADLEALREKAVTGDPVAAANYANAISSGLAAGTPADMVRLRSLAVAAGRDDVSRALVTAIGLASWPAPETIAAVRTLESAAEAASPPAMTALGMLYSTGGAVPPDLPQAVVWFGRAASAGDAEGAFRLGLALASGLGTGRDIESARLWLKKAAEGGQPLAAAVAAGLP